MFTDLAGSATEAAHHGAATTALPAHTNREELHVLEPRPARAGSKPVWHKPSPFTKPDPRKAVWQLIHTLVPYAVLWAAMAATVLYGLPYWVTLLLAVPAAVLAVRTFIFFHDAGHGSFLASSRANAVVGYLCGILTFTSTTTGTVPTLHHATAGNLDRRGVGDVWTMTVDEYLFCSTRAGGLPTEFSATRWSCSGWGPAFMFLLRPTLPRRGSKRRERLSVFTPTGLGCHPGRRRADDRGRPTPASSCRCSRSPACSGCGCSTSSTSRGRTGRGRGWTPPGGAGGQLLLQMPAFFRWCTGNIGLHHIHHLRPRIANYHLQPCMDTIAEFRQVRPLTFGRSLKSLRMNLWDERRTSGHSARPRFPADGQPRPVVGTLCGCPGPTPRASSRRGNPSVAR
jgi:omega-6 fatty acid desaturase (delta-12 desaturase)